MFVQLTCDNAMTVEKGATETHKITFAKLNGTGKFNRFILYFMSKSPPIFRFGFDAQWQRVFLLLPKMCNSTSIDERKAHTFNLKFNHQRVSPTTKEREIQ